MEGAISQLRKKPKLDDKELRCFNDGSNNEFKPFFERQPDNEMPPVMAHPDLATAALQLGYSLRNGVLDQGSDQNAEEV